MTYLNPDPVSHVCCSGGLRWRERVHAITGLGDQVAAGGVHD